MPARLTSALLVSHLTRRAFALGGSAAILTKGDPGAGALMLQLREKGAFSGLWDPILTPSGDYCWVKNVDQTIDNKQLFENYLDRRRAIDPDLWIIELDVPNAERFIAELTVID